MDGAAAVEVAESRAFVARTVRFLAVERGITQFVDLGSGPPATSDLHGAGRDAGREARVVYADADFNVVTQGEAQLTGNPNAGIIAVDLRDPVGVIGHVGLLRLVDTSRPFALVMNRVLDVISDRDRPYGLMYAYRAWLPVGGYLVISHAGPGAAGQAIWRPVEHIREFFGDFTLTDPGLVQLPGWRPDGRHTRRAEVPVWGDVAHKTNGARA